MGETRRPSAREFRAAARTPMGGEEAPRLRTPPMRVRVNTYLRNQELYDGIQSKYPDGDKVVVKASVILISGCQDNQLSLDGFRNGLFTGKLRSVWQNGAFQGSYRDFHRDIESLMPGNQTPNFSIVGVQNPDFENQNPFSI
jgi:hypothetical protein